MLGFVLPVFNDGYRTCNGSPFVGDIADFEISPNQPGSEPHDTNPESSFSIPVLRKTGAIIYNSKPCVVIRRCKVNGNFTGVSVFNGVANSFLCNPVEMNGLGDIVKVKITKHIK